MIFLRGKIDFILRHSGWPQQPHHLRVRFGAQSRQNRRGILPQITGRASHFPFLIQRARVEFDLGSNTTLVVVQRLQVNAHPTALIPAFVTQHQRRAPQLRHDQIGVAISIDVRKGNRARLIHFHRVEPHALRHVAPTLASQIAQQP